MMNKKGFTLIEVILFLALSGSLITIAILGTSRNIASKRYNDTVDNFKSYLEGIYSSVSYVVHDGGGNYDKAIYGKLINMKTETVAGETTTTFTSYTIKGLANVAVNESDALTQLLRQNPELIDDAAHANLISESYSPNWGGRITAAPAEATLTGDVVDDANEQNQVILLVIRHAQNGMTSTYIYYPDPAHPIDIDHSTELYNAAETGLLQQYDIDNTDPTDPKIIPHFTKRDANFCVDSDDRWADGNQRRLIRIHTGASNSSGVEAIANDRKGNYCYDTL